MLGIPLNPVPSQTLNVTLADQPCQINVYTLADLLFMDVLLLGAAVANGVPCQDRNRIVRAAYTGFIGDFAFTDTQGTSDPTYDGLGSRYQLVYLEASEL